MIYSKSSEYAFRALTYLAIHSDRTSMVKDIAQAESLPAHFLAKILQNLCRAGLVRSFRGPTGGFQLDRPANQITLYDVVHAIEHLSLEERCAVGLEQCRDDVPCPMHDMFKGLRQRILRYLKDNTIADLAEALKLKKESLASSESLSETQPQA